MVEFGCDHIVMAVLGVVMMMIVGFDYNCVVVMVEASCDHDSMVTAGFGCDLSVMVLVLVVAFDADGWVCLWLLSDGDGWAQWGACCDVVPAMVGASLNCVAMVAAAEFGCGCAATTLFGADCDCVMKAVPAGLPTTHLTRLTMLLPPQVLTTTATR